MFYASKTAWGQFDFENISFKQEKSFNVKQNINISTYLETLNIEQGQIDPR